MFLRGCSRVLRWREDVIENGSLRRINRSEALGTRENYPTIRLAQRAAADRVPGHRPSEQHPAVHLCLGDRFRPSDWRHRDARLWQVIATPGDHRYPSAGTVAATRRDISSTLPPGRGILPANGEVYPKET